MSIIADSGRPILAPRSRHRSARLSKPLEIGNPSDNLILPGIFPIETVGNVSDNGRCQRD
jgi:hypothetical protein